MLDAGLTDQTEMPAFNICQHAWLFASTENAGGGAPAVNSGVNGRWLRDFSNELHDSVRIRVLKFSDHIGE